MKNIISFVLKSELQTMFQDTEMFHCRFFPP